MCALYSNTYSAVRQMLRSQVGDLILVTAGTPVSSTTCVDTTLRQAADYYNQHGYKGYCYSGSAIGQERDVSDFATVGSVTFAPAFSPAIAAGDLFEFSHIFNEKECRRAVNMGIEAAAGKYLIDLIDTTTITLSADTYEYALPTNFLYVNRIITENEVGDGIFNKEDEIDFRDWDVIKAYPPKLKLDENRYSITAGKDLRLEGHGTQALVTADITAIYLPPDWLVQKAITLLPMVKIQANALQDTYKVALELSARIPTTYPDVLTRRVVE